MDRWIALVALYLSWAGMDRGAQVSDYKPTGVGLLDRGRDWKVNDLGDSPMGFTDLVRKELSVSLKSSRAATRWTQLHELSHVKHSKWTPGRIRNVASKKLGVELSPELILAAEDARINKKLLDKLPDCTEGYQVTSPLRMDTPGYLSSHYGPEEARKVCGRFLSVKKRKSITDIVKKFVADGKGTVTDFTIPVAKAVEVYLETENEKQALQAGQDLKEKAQELAKAEEGGDGGDNGDNGEDESLLGKEDADKPICCKPNVGSGTGRSEAYWVIPTVEDYPSRRVVRQVKGNFTNQTVETGTVFRPSQLHRIATDGTIFSRKRRRPGQFMRGTVLIDYSGSMNWRMDHIIAVIDSIPFATVAIYHGNGRRDCGVIEIVAEGGTRVEKLPRTLNGNTCDGPALLWLSRRPGPRVWICDGYVTGVGDASPASLAKEAKMIMEATGIIQILPDKKPIISRRYMAQSCSLSNPKDLIQAFRRLEKGLTG